MGCVELSSDGRPGVVWRFRVLGSLWERAVGLLGTRPDALPVLLLRCSSVHTFAMRYPLDLAFVARDGQVLLVRTRVPPGRVVSRHDAFCVLERPSSTEPWLREGERVRMLSLNADDGTQGCPNERIDYECL